MSTETSFENLRTDFNRWTYKEFITFANAIRTGEFLPSNKTLAKVLPDHTEETLRSMPLELIVPLRYEVTIRMNDYIKALDMSQVEVDFGDWTDVEMSEFQRSQREADVDKTERMMLEVCEIEGVDSPPLSFKHGAMCSRAITEHYKKLLSGEY